MEKKSGFLSENFQFLEVQFSIYNRRDFVMYCNKYMIKLRVRGLSGMYVSYFSAKSFVVNSH